MKLDQLHEMAATNPKFLLVHIADNQAAYDFAEQILNRFGYKDVGSCVDIDESDYWNDDKMDDSPVGREQLEQVGIWAKNAGPSEQQVINALAAGNVISFGE